MLNSMTGFGSREAKIASLGKICVELRSTNHKFLETVLHLPERFLAAEEKIKKTIEAKIKRGRVTCVINIAGGEDQAVFINKRLLKNYVLALKKTKAQLKIKAEVSLDTLIHLPGVLALAESKIPKERVWPQLNLLVSQTLDDLVKMRSTEGRALSGYLKFRTEELKAGLEAVGGRFKKVIRDKVAKLKTDEERVSFLKTTDISEEMERLGFHIGNFQNKLLKRGPIGKELDFIAQEMQREANTMAAKSCDAMISGRVIQIKSQIEKIREQVQNIE